jgi:acyl carrier protein
MTSALWPRLQAVLLAHAPLPRPAVEPSDRLIEDLGFDSLALARAVVALESEFGTELPPERLHELRTATAGALAELLEEALAA